MADEPEILFEIDASKILAKLHFGGKAAAGADANSFIVNTGIKDDTDNGSPEDPGNTTFDLENSQGIYEVGYVTEITYSKKVSIYRTALLDYSKNEAQVQTNNSKEPLTGDNKKSEAERMELEKKFIDKWQKQGEIISKKFKGMSPKDISAELDKLEKDAAKESEKYSAALDKAKDSASKRLQSYMTNFAGPDAGKNVTVESLFMINISDSIKDSNDKDLVANYEIQPISDKDKELMLKKFQADPSKCIERVCFKVKYTIDIEK